FSRRIVVVPTANVHQSSIRAQAAAHDVSIRSSTNARRARRGWASQSVSRSRRTINNPENARTGTPALGSNEPARRPSHGGDRYVSGSPQLAPTAKLVIVNAIAEHDVEANKKLAGESDFRLRAPTATEHGKITATEILIGACGERGGLSEDPAQKRIALLGDLAEMLLVRRGVDGGRQADITHDVFAVREPCDGAEDEDRRESGERADPRVGQEQGGPRIGRHGLSDLGIELVDLRGQPGKQLEIVVATARGVTGKEQAFERGTPALGPKLRAKRQAMIQRDGLKPFFTIVRMRTRRTRWATSARRSRVSGSGIQTVGKRSCRRRSSRCRASRRSVFVLRTTIALIFAASPTRTV